MLEPCVLDRSGLYISEAFDLHKDPERFSRVKAGCALISEEQLGMDPHVRTSRRNGGTVQSVKAMMMMRLGKPSRI